MISKKARTEIAMIVNGIVVAASTRREADLDAESKHEWFLRECRLEVELADKFGIELPGLEHSRAILKFDALMNSAAA
ncbi:hypothetical protein UFOVP728_34 [uncultured Caudovirales phage]|uniref:Uncharacterized protein n=1 Tax=uncultured Caudovirales phage TaxID=2100421 RepID=A0A6J5NVS6_9CAUD|nr:hypothetical protein UFOVP728_34 [uncultured Caudovirales phage]